MITTSGPFVVCCLQPLIELGLLPLQLKRQQKERLCLSDPKKIPSNIPGCPRPLQWQVIWWQQTLRFWNGLAALPVGSLYHTVCLDKVGDAFQGGACNMASSVADCLRSVGYDMPRVFDVMPLLDVDNIVQALTVQLQDGSSAALYCLVRLPLGGVVSCTYKQWFTPYSLCRPYCHLPVIGRCMCMQRFMQFRLGCHSLPVAGCAWLAIVVLWGMRCT